jgi:hypothetical protein
MLNCRSCAWTGAAIAMMQTPVASAAIRLLDVMKFLPPIFVSCLLRQAGGTFV